MVRVLIAGKISPKGNRPIIDRASRSPAEYSFATSIRAHTVGVAVWPSRCDDDSNPPGNANQPHSTPSGFQWVRGSVPHCSSIGSPAHMLRLKRPTNGHRTKTPVAASFLAMKPPGSPSVRDHEDIPGAMSGSRTWRTGFRLEDAPCPWAGCPPRLGSWADWTGRQPDVEAQVRSSVSCSTSIPVSSCGERFPISWKTRPRRYFRS